MLKIGAADEGKELVEKDNEKNLDSKSPTSELLKNEPNEFDEKKKFDSNVKLSKKRSRFAEAFRSLSKSTNTEVKIKKDLKINSSDVSSKAKSLNVDDDTALKDEEHGKTKILQPLNCGEIYPETYQFTKNIESTNADLVENKNKIKKTPKQKLEIIIRGTKTNINAGSVTDSRKNEHQKTDNSNSTNYDGIKDSTIPENINNNDFLSCSRSSKKDVKKVVSVVAVTQRKRESFPIRNNAIYSTISREKIIITQNSADLPPTEKAPAKPLSLTHDSTKFIRPNQKIFIRTNSEHNQQYSSVSQKIETNIKKVKSFGNKEQGVHDILHEVETSNLTQDYKNHLQRGHRFPKPSKVLSITSKDYGLDTRANKNIVTTNTKQRMSGYTVPSNQNCETVLPDFTLNSSSEALINVNSESKNATKESRKKIRYVDSSIFDVYDSLTTSNAILQSGNKYLGEKSGIADEKELSDKIDTEAVIMPTSNINSTEKREHLYKILVIGELGCGKTSFIKRYVHQFFSQNYRATIGVDFALKVLHWDQNTVVRLQLWDIAGQERFGNMTRVYYKEAVGAFIVFDVTRIGTFDCVSKWKDDLDSKVQLPDGRPIPCILLANKSDQEKQGLVTSNEKMNDYVRDNGFAGWFETSAKENINIDEAANALVNRILLNDKLVSPADLKDIEKLSLHGTADQGDTGIHNKCSC